MKFLVCSLSLFATLFALSDAAAEAPEGCPKCEKCDTQVKPRTYSPMGPRSFDSTTTFTSANQNPYVDQMMEGDDDFMPFLYDMMAMSEMVTDSAMKKQAAAAMAADAAYAADAAIAADAAMAAAEEGAKATGKPAYRKRRSVDSHTHYASAGGSGQTSYGGGSGQTSYGGGSGQTSYGGGYGQNPTAAEPVFGSQLAPNWWYSVGPSNPLLALRDPAYATLAYLRHQFELYGPPRSYQYPAQPDSGSGWQSGGNPYGWQSSGNQGSGWQSGWQSTSNQGYYPSQAQSSGSYQRHYSTGGYH